MPWDAPDDRGPLTDVLPEHGDEGTPLSPWTAIAVIAGLIAAILAVAFLV